MISNNTLKNLTDTLDLILDKFEKETGCKMMLAFSLVEDDQFETGVVISEEADFAEAAKMCTLIVGNVSIAFGEAEQIV